MRWNLLVQEDRIEKLDGDFPTEYLEAEKNPAIIHYIIDRKPWKKHLVLYESEFWNVAQETPWFTELQDNLICSD